MKAIELLSTKFWPSIYFGFGLDAFLLVFGVTLFGHGAFLFYIALFASLISKLLILVIRRNKMNASDLFWIRTGGILCLVITFIYAVVFRK